METDELVDILANIAHDYMGSDQTTPETSKIIGEAIFKHAPEHLRDLVFDAIKHKVMDTLSDFIDEAFNENN